MNLLSLTRTEVIAFVESGLLRPENVKHYDICKALASGKLQREVAEMFNIPEIKLVKYVKQRKCPDCKG